LPAGYIEHLRRLTTDIWPPPFVCFRTPLAGALQWEEEDVAFKLDAHMVKVFRDMLKTASEERLTLRQAAYNIALQRIVSSDMRKGFA